MADNLFQLDEFGDASPTDGVRGSGSLVASFHLGKRLFGACVTSLWRVEPCAMPPDCCSACGLLTARVCSRRAYGTVCRGFTVLRLRPLTSSQAPRGTCGSDGAGRAG